MSIIRCWECDKEISSTAPNCPHCGAIIESKSQAAGSTLNSKIAFSPPVITGIIGSAIMALGVFLPFIKAPFVGNLNLFKGGQGDGVFMLLFALGALICFLVRGYLTAVVLGLVSGALLVFDTVDAANRLGNARSLVERELYGNPFKDLATGMVNSIQFEFGVFVLFVGVIMILVAAFWGNSVNKPEKVVKAVEVDTVGKYNSR